MSRIEHLARAEAEWTHQDVIAGLDPAIHLLCKCFYAKGMDPRVKPAGDRHTCRWGCAKLSEKCLSLVSASEVPSDGVPASSWRRVKIELDQGSKMNRGA